MTSQRRPMVLAEGFTLVELLVVISIIGLLSSVILAGLSGARSKASITSSLVFDQNMYHAMGDQLIGDWQFSEGSGSTAKDSSPTGGDATWQGTATWGNGITPTGAGSSVKISTNNYLKSTKQINITSNAFTTSVWVYDLGTKAGSGGRAVFAIRDSGGVGGDAYYIQTYMTDAFGGGCSGDVSSYFSTGSYTGPVVCGTYPTPNQWHNIVSTYDGANFKMYIDGKQAGNTATAVTVNLNGGNYVQIGNDNHSNFFNGYIDSLRIYSRAITAQEVESRYLAGLPAHTFARLDLK